MKKKRVIKLLMAMGYSRNEAVACAERNVVNGNFSYREFGRMLQLLDKGDLF